MKNALLAACLLLVGLSLYLLFGRGDSRRSEAIRAPSRTPNAEPAPTVEPEPATTLLLEGGREAASSRTSPAALSTANPSRRITGSVLAQGVALQHATVRVYAAGKLQAEEKTDAQGSFALLLPTPAESVTLRVEAEGYAALERELGRQVATGELALGGLHLQPGLELRGIVVGRGGMPVEGAEVRLTLQRGQPSEHAIGERTLTLADGSFVFPAAPQGRVVVSARADGLGERSVDLSVVGGEEPRIVLEPARSLALRVVDLSGAPIAQADVTIRSADPSTPARAGKTDAQGRIRFEELGAPTWSVRAHASGFRPTGLPQASADGTEVAIELSPWPAIVGRLVTPAGAPAPAGSRVMALPRAAVARGDAAAAAVNDGVLVEEDGRFRVGDVRPGEYVVLARASGFASTLSPPVIVGEKGESSIGNLVLQLGGALELQVHCRGQPIAGVSVEVCASSPAPAQVFASPMTAWTHTPAPAAAPTETDAEGFVRLEGLASGPLWTILRSPRTVPKAAGPFQIASGSVSGPLTVELQEGSRLHGRVLAASDAGVPRWRLRITGGTVSIPFLETDEAGRFQSCPLPPGPYTIQSLPSAAGGAAPVEVRLDPGSDREVEIRIEEGAEQGSAGQG